MRSPKPSSSQDAREGTPFWWGIHYDDRGVERERRSFRTRKDARAWVKAMKAKERGDLSEAAE